MLPRGNTWNEWSAAEKANFVALVSTPLAFLATVVFSYLSWQEATASRQDQRDFFLSQNAPNLQIRHMSVVGKTPEPRILTFRVENIGGSTASDGCIIVLEIPDAQVFNTCVDESSPFNSMTIRRGGAQTLPALKLDRLEGDGKIVLDAKAFEHGKSSESYSVRHMIVLKYEDVSGRKYSAIEPVYLKYRQ